MRYEYSTWRFWEYIYRIGNSKTNKHKYKHVIYEMILLIYGIRFGIGIIFLKKAHLWPGYVDVDVWVYQTIKNFLHSNYYSSASLIFLTFYAITVDYFTTFSIRKFVGTNFEEYYMCIVFLEQLGLREIYAKFRMNYLISKHLVTREAFASPKRLSQCVYFICFINVLSSVFVVLLGKLIFFILLF